MTKAIGTLALAIALVTSAFAQRYKPLDISAARGDPPPGEALSLTLDQARAQLQELLEFSNRWQADLYGTSGRYGLVATQTTLRRSGLDVVQANNGERKSYAFKALDYYSVWGRGGAYFATCNCRTQGQMLKTKEQAEKYAEAVNRLIYAAHRGELGYNAIHFEKFQIAAKAWRESPTKPLLSEAADRERILAENAISEKNMQSAVDHYDAGLEADPMWPQGWYNAALIYGQLQQYDDASEHMKHYLELAPDAPDAKAAREQMIIWEDKAKTGAPQPTEGAATPYANRTKHGGKAIPMAVPK
jgi:tetratricopeptide (TPR) repeat protein